MYFYKAYGLNIASEFTLPELTSGGNGSDLTIRNSQIKLPELNQTIIKRQSLQSWFGGTVTEAYMYWERIGKFLAKNGNELIVEPENENIYPALLNLFILSEALGMILYQQGALLLHASAIQVGKSVIVIIGNPGAGKSTTAAAFAKRGHTVLTDDMVAIDVQENLTPQVIPGFPQIKIWPSSVEGLGYDAASLEVLFPGSTKREIRQKENFPFESLPLQHIYFLDKGQELSISTMNKTEALLSFARYFPCPYDLLQQKAHKNHFLQCSEIVKHIPISKIERPNDFAVLNHWITGIEKEYSSLKFTS